MNDLKIQCCLTAFCENLGAGVGLAKTTLLSKSRQMSTFRGWILSQHLTLLQASLAWSCSASAAVPSSRGSAELMEDSKSKWEGYACKEMCV